MKTDFFSSEGEKITLFPFLTLYLLSLILSLRTQFKNSLHFVLGVKGVTYHVIDVLCVRVSGFPFQGLDAITTKFLYPPTYLQQHEGYFSMTIHNFVVQRNVTVKYKQNILCSLTSLANS